MNVLQQILATIQTDPGQRGLAKDPTDNLFTATVGDFERACQSFAKTSSASVKIYTGFFIPSAEPPAFETDGPLGAKFLADGLTMLGIPCEVCGEETIRRLIPTTPLREPPTHLLAIERPGPTADGSFRTMRTRDITSHHATVHAQYELDRSFNPVTIGIGDGGNEIGMGNISHETLRKNIPAAEVVHCRVGVNHLVVCGVSNWGAYALVAGVAVLLGRKDVISLFDAAREQVNLEAMVQAGPLVDGVSGRMTATVDGLSWEDYTRPMLAIRQILEAN
ncbi:MAG: glutamate cyclase domain-containing protein [Fimbriiglobus sp.]